MKENLTIAKIKCIQAEADVFQVNAEAGAASQEFYESLAEYEGLDREMVAAKTKAEELIAAARKHLAEAGKSEEESLQLCQVTFYFCDGTDDVRKGKLMEQSKSSKHNWKKKKMPFESINSKTPKVSLNNTKNVRSKSKKSKLVCFNDKQKPTKLLAKSPNTGIYGNHV